MQEVSGSIPLSSTKFPTLAAKRGFLSLLFAAFVIQSTSGLAPPGESIIDENRQQAGPCLLRDANKLIICVPENPDQ